MLLSIKQIVNANLASTLQVEELLVLLPLFLIKKGSSSIKSHDSVVNTQLCTTDRSGLKVQLSVTEVR